MKNLIFAGLLSCCPFAFALSPMELPLSVHAVTDKNMKDYISNLKDSVPTENSTIIVYSGNIAGPIKVLETNSCTQATEYLRPKVGNKPMLIMDGGYTVQVNTDKRQFLLKSSDESLFTWMNNCNQKLNSK